jgi:cytochrome P450
MVFNDPPRQMELRLMVAKTFGIRSMARLQASIEEIVNRLIDRIQHARQADLIADFAVPHPTLVIARLLGVPEADAPVLKVWSDEIALFVGTSLDVPDRRQRAERAVLAMRFPRAAPHRSLLRLRAARPTRRERLFACPLALV